MITTRSIDRHCHRYWISFKELWWWNAIWSKTWFSFDMEYCELSIVLFFSIFRVISLIFNRCNPLFPSSESIYFKEKNSLQSKFTMNNNPFQLFCWSIFEICYLFCIIGSNCLFSCYVLHLIRISKFFLPALHNRFGSIEQLFCDKSISNGPKIYLTYRRK